MTLTPQEEYLIKMLREAVPYERIEIVKDRGGKPNSYMVYRSQKLEVSEIRIEAIK